MTGATLPNEAQAWGWYKAHQELALGLPQPIPGSDEWLVPCEHHVKVKPLKGGQVTAPPSPGSAAEAARLHAEDRPRISERAARAAEKRKAEAEKQAEQERRRQAQPTFV